MSAAIRSCSPADLIHSALCASAGGGGVTPQHRCPSVPPHLGKAGNRSITSITHSFRFLAQRKQLKMSFLVGKKTHFQCQFCNQTGEKMMGHFKLGRQAPANVTARKSSAGKDRGWCWKVTVLAGTDKMLILTDHIFLSI